MKTSTTKKQDNHKSKKETKIASISPMDFHLTAILTEEDLKTNQVDIDKIETANDLAFLGDDEVLFDKINLNSTNPVVNTLYYLNKSSSQKSYVELIALQGQKYTEEEELLEDAFKHVTETKNNMFLKELNFNCPAKLVFQAKCGKKLSKAIQITGPKKEESNEEVKKDDKTLEKEKKKKLNKIVTSLDKFDYLYLDLNEFITIQTVLSFEDLRNVVKKALNTYKTLNLIVNCPNIIDNVNVVNIELLGFIEEILAYADICIFEKKDALAFFSTLNTLNGGPDNYNNLQDKHLDMLFCSQIRALRKGKTKTGLFLDDFSKLHVIERNGDEVIYRSTYDFLLHPKINHTNQKIVDEYKKHIVLNHQLLKSIFLGGFISRICNRQSFYPAFLVGSEITKRILELLRNKLDYPLQNEFYIVKLQKTKIEKEMEIEYLKSKEQRFVLDCVNKNSSKLRYYNPLMDEHLNPYFASGFVRKQLKEKGFIDTNGFILYDSVYRSSIGASPKQKENTPTETEKEKQLLYAIKQKNLVVRFNLILGK
jgi:hypothetical protein